MKQIFFISLLFSSGALLAQKTVDITSGDVNATSLSFFNVVGGTPFVSAKFTKLVEGSPYFNDDWMKGNIIIGEQAQYAGIYVKLDLYDNEVHYRDAAGREMIAVSPITKLVLFDSATQQIHTFVNGANIKANKPVTGWYELLSEGKASLFKQIKKDLSQNRPYGSATYEQRITTSSHYFILYNDLFTEIRKMKDVPDIFSEKKEEVGQYIKNKNPSARSEGDMISLVNYYNSL